MYSVYLTCIGVCIFYQDKYHVDGYTYGRPWSLAKHISLTNKFISCLNFKRNSLYKLGNLCSLARVCVCAQPRSLHGCGSGLSSAQKHQHCTRCPKVLETHQNNLERVKLIRSSFLYYREDIIMFFNFVSMPLYMSIIDLNIQIFYSWISIILFTFYREERGTLFM